MLPVHGVHCSCAVRALLVTCIAPIATRHKLAVVVTYTQVAASLLATLQLQTLNLSCGAVEHLPQQLVKQLPMPNGATNWPGTDDSFVLLTQVCIHALAASRRRQYLMQPVSCIALSSFCNACM
jgi:hypothetical protein